MKNRIKQLPTIEDINVSALDADTLLHNIQLENTSLEEKIKSLLLLSKIKQTNLPAAAISHFVDKLPLTHALLPFLANLLALNEVDEFLTRFESLSVNNNRDSCGQKFARNFRFLVLTAPSEIKKTLVARVYARREKRQHICSIKKTYFSILLQSLTVLGTDRAARCLSDALKEFNSPYRGKNILMLPGIIATRAHFSEEQKCTIAKTFLKSDFAFTSTVLYKREGEDYFDFFDNYAGYFTQEELNQIVASLVRTDKVSGEPMSKKIAAICVEKLEDETLKSLFWEIEFNEKNSFEILSLFWQDKAGKVSPTVIAMIRHKFQLGRVNVVQAAHALRTSFRFAAPETIELFFFHFFKSLPHDECINGCLNDERIRNFFSESLNLLPADRFLVLLDFLFTGYPRALSTRVGIIKCFDDLVKTEQRAENKNKRLFELDNVTRQTLIHLAVTTPLDLLTLKENDHETHDRRALVKYLAERVTEYKTHRRDEIASSMINEYQSPYEILTENKKVADIVKALAQQITEHEPPQRPSQAMLSTLQAREAKTLAVLKQRNQQKHQSPRRCHSVSELTGLLNTPV